MFYKFFFTAWVVLIVSFAVAQSPLTITPSTPERGQEITIQYDPLAPGAKIPAGANKVELVFTYSNLYEVANRIQLQKKGDKWETSFRLPRYATYATFYLQSGDIREQPAKDQQYGIAVFDKGKRVFSGYLYEGYSLSAQMGKAPGLGAKQAALFQKELESNPDNYEAKLRLLNYRMSKAEGSEKVKLSKEAEGIIAAKFYEDPGNMAFMNKTTMGYLIIGQQSRLDSIRQVAREKYPKSEAGYELRIEQIKKGEDTIKMVAALQTILKEENKTNKRFLREAHETLMEYYASKGQTANALMHLQNLGTEEGPYKAPTLKKHAELFYRSGIALDTAYALATRSLALADSFPVGLIRYFPETGHIPSYADEQTKKATYSKARGNLMTLMALIKLKGGMRNDNLVTGALQLSADAETLSNAGEYYSKTGAHKEAFEAYKKIIWQSPEDVASTEKMKAAYLAWNNSLEGLDKHMSELDEHWRTEMTLRLQKEIINIKSPEFVSNLVDLNGQAVSKEKMQNKILVLDFWATWCVPCMQEMPYLQKVYEQFKGDPDVEFLVINSGSKNSLDDAKGWWGNKKYSFPVYYNNDPMIGEKLAFNVIPAVYIIDKSGNIRFKTIGFEGPVIERKIASAITLLKKPL